MKHWKNVSRAMAQALRHAPERYGLTLDEEGWVELEELLDGLRARRPQWGRLTAADVAEIMRRADKQRFEVRDDRIRAFYGHSTPERLEKESAEPPARLFHGTAPETVRDIGRTGLRPMSRQYVHLSADLETAEEVGGRKARTPVVLEVRADEAHAAGVPFYLGNEQVWLADEIPASYLDVVLYRPVGPAELELLRAADSRRYPPRLPEQPIFYPVVQRHYVEQIAHDWNVPESGSGFVTRFRVAADFLSRYDLHEAGGRDHTEYWIPAEELADFNDHIRGQIEVVGEYE